MWRGVGKFWIGGFWVEQKKRESSVEVSRVGNLVKKKRGRKGSLSCVLVAGLSKRKRGCLICSTCIEKTRKVGSAEGFNAPFLLCLFHMCIP